MPNWNEVLDEIRGVSANNPLDTVRKSYLKLLSKHRNRNVIAYYSGWLSQKGTFQYGITDKDKNALMAAIQQLDRKKGLDLILHTPGGDIAATESIIHYLTKMFQNNIVAFVPQLAMSGGTMIACSCKEIYMGKQSNLGPIDPQLNGMPAHGIIKEFETAVKECKEDPNKIPFWQTIIGKYHPTFIGECQNAIKLADELVEKQLKEIMFKGDKEASKKAKKITSCLNEHEQSKTHSRHIHVDEAKSYGLKIIDLEKDQKLQDLVLTVHHCYMHSFDNSSAIKIIENHAGQGIIEAVMPQ